MICATVPRIMLLLLTMVARVATMVERLVINEHVFVRSLITELTFVGVCPRFFYHRKEKKPGSSVQKKKKKKRKKKKSANTKSNARKKKIKGRNERKRKIK
jgi:hypothetical protein